MTDKTEESAPLTKQEEMKALQAQKKALNEQQKALREELDATKGARKESRKAQAQARKDIQEAKTEMRQLASESHATLRDGSSEDVNAYADKITEASAKMAAAVRSFAKAQDVIDGVIAEDADEGEDI